MNLGCERHLQDLRASKPSSFLSRVILRWEGFRGFILFPAIIPHGPWWERGKDHDFFSSPNHFIFSPSTRFKSLQSKLATRHIQLQASVEFYRFDCLSNLELTWVAEHMPNSGPTCPAHCWHDAQSLQRKHKVVLPVSSQGPQYLIPRT